MVTSTTIFKNYCEFLKCGKIREILRILKPEVTSSQSTNFRFDFIIRQAIVGLLVINFKCESYLLLFLLYCFVHIDFVSDETYVVHVC